MFFSWTSICGGDGDDDEYSNGHEGWLYCHAVSPSYKFYVIFSIFFQYAIYLKHVSVEKFNDEYWRHMQALLDPIVASNDVIDNDNNEDADVDGVMMMMMPFSFPVLLFFKTSGLGQETCVLCL